MNDVNSDANPAKPAFNYLVAFWGLLIAGLGCFLALSVLSTDLRLEPEIAAQQNVTGLAGAWLAYGAVIVLGYPAAYAASALMFAWGGLIMRNSEFWATWTNVFGGVFLTAGAAIFSGNLVKTPLFTGGLFYRVTAPYFTFYLGDSGALLISGLLIFFGGILAFGNLLIAAGEIIGGKFGATIAGIFYAARRAFGDSVRAAKPQVAALAANSATENLATGGENKEAAREIASAPIFRQAANLPVGAASRNLAVIPRPGFRAASSPENSHSENSAATPVLPPPTARFGWRTFAADRENWSVIPFDFDPSPRENNGETANQEQTPKTELTEFAAARELELEPISEIIDDDRDREPMCLERNFSAENAEIADDDALDQSAESGGESANDEHIENAAIEDSAPDELLSSGENELTESQSEFSAENTEIADDDAIDQSAENGGESANDEHIENAAIEDSAPEELLSSGENELTESQPKFSAENAEIADDDIIDQSAESGGESTNDEHIENAAIEDSAPEELLSSGENELTESQPEFPAENAEIADDEIIDQSAESGGESTNDEIIENDETENYAPNEFLDLRENAEPQMKISDDELTAELAATAVAEEIQATFGAFAINAAAVISAADSQTADSRRAVNPHSALRKPAAESVITVDAEIEEIAAEIVADENENDSEPNIAPPSETAPSAAAAYPLSPSPHKLVPVRPAPLSNPPAARQTLAEIKKTLPPYALPDLTILDTPPPPLNADIAALERRATQLIRTLNHFKIQGQVVSVQQGPRITQFEIAIAAGIPVSKIRNLADNIAMDLRALSVRIIAPIPGRDTIGIEIPNLKSELVALREIVEQARRAEKPPTLPLCLAKDVAGNPIIADLAKMPHLLIAGSTGSGKSVCINSIIMSFLMCMTPEQCKLIMVDPKVVELSRFHDIPHLMSPVITDMQKAVGVLDWACQEMDERYEKLSMVSVNNLEKFNALGEREIADRVARRYGEEELAKFPRQLPCIVIIIDELADLMMVAKKEVEHHIARLAAKSRAVGIHLILATQRPSADVITGLIKANMPSRIAFQVASKLDSRIILDQSGADALLGQGDMLYLPPGTGKVQRAQGVFVSDAELFRVVDFCKAQRDPEYHASLAGATINGGARGEIDFSKLDELFFESGETIIEEQRGSVSLLQRKFGVGYGRAARIVDQLAECGVLGPFRGSGKPREILMEMSEFRESFGETDRSVHLAGLRPDERPRETYAD